MSTTPAAKCRINALHAPASGGASTWHHPRMGESTPQRTSHAGTPPAQPAHPRGRALLCFHAGPRGGSRWIGRRPRERDHRRSAANPDDASAHLAARSRTAHRSRARSCGPTPLAGHRWRSGDHTAAARAAERSATDGRTGGRRGGRLHPADDPVPGRHQSTDHARAGAATGHHPGRGLCALAVVDHPARNARGSAVRGKRRSAQHRSRPRSPPPRFRPPAGGAGERADRATRGTCRSRDEGFSGEMRRS